MQIEIRRQAEILWQEVFGDNEIFIKRLFDLYYDDKHFYSIFEDGVLKSMLFILDYELLIEGRKYKGAYLYGFCAKSEYRKQGTAKQLLEQTEQKLKRSGFDYIFLIAASDRLIDYYKDLDFASCHSHKLIEWHIEREKPDNSSIFSLETSKQINISLYQTFASKRQNAVLHSAKDLSLYENTEYDIYYLWKQDRLLALAIVRYLIEECVVLDIVGESAECEKRLLDCIFLASNRRLLYPLLQTKPADTQSRSPYMLKPLSDKANCCPIPLYFNLLLDK